MPLDYTSALIGAASSCAALAIFLALFQASHRGLPGVSWWVASVVLLELSLLLYIFRKDDWYGEVDYSASIRFLAIWCPGVLIGAAGVSMLCGLREAVGAKGDMRRLCLVFGIQILVFSACTYLRPSMVGRVFSLSAFLCWVSFSAAWVVYRHAERELASASRLLIVVFVVLAGGYAFRAWGAGRYFFADAGVLKQVQSSAAILLTSGVNFLWVVSGVVFVLQREKLLAARRQEQTLQQDVKRQLEDHRARLSRDVHDSLSGTLATISLLASEGLETEQSRDALDRIRRLSTSATQDLCSLLNKLSAPESSLRQWLAELRVMASRVTEDAGLQLHLEASGFDARPLGAPLAGVNLLRAAQEAMHNAMRHAHASSIFITVEADAVRLRLSIADDGVGFPAVIHSGRGFLNLEHRARELGGVFSYEHGAGAKICLEVPLPLAFQNSI